MVTSGKKTIKTIGTIGIGMVGSGYPIDGKKPASHDLPTVKQVATVAIILLILASVGYFLTRPAAVQQDTDTDPADTLTKDPSDDGGGLGSLLAASAGADTVPLTTDTGEVINVPITVTNVDNKIIASNLVIITNLRYNSANQEITGEIKSGFPKEIPGLHAEIWMSAPGYRNGAFVSLMQKRSVPIRLQSAPENILTTIMQIEVILTGIPSDL